MASWGPTLHQAGTYREESQSLSLAGTSSEGSEHQLRLHDELEATDSLDDLRRTRDQIVPKLGGPLKGLRKVSAHRPTCRWISNSPQEPRLSTTEVVEAIADVLVNLFDVGALLQRLRVECQSGMRQGCVHIKYTSGWLAGQASS